MISLGREPQDPAGSLQVSPGGTTDDWTRREPRPASIFLSPLRGFLFF